MSAERRAAATRRAVGAAALPASPLTTSGSVGSSLRRLVGPAAVALGLYCTATGLVVYLFLVRQLGYYYFDSSDIALYFDYARRVWSGARPFIDFPVEYPPLAVTLFSVVVPPTASLERYAVQFALFMSGLGAVSAVLTVATAARPGCPRWAALRAGAAFSLGVLATGALLGNRFDVGVTLVLAAATLLLTRGWHSTAAAVLGLGFALKLVPAILVPLPLLLARSRRGALLSAGAFALAAAAPFVPYLFEGAGGVVRLFTYHGARPLQVESVLATPLWIASVLGASPVEVDTAFGSQFVIATGAETLARASGMFQLALIATTYGFIWRRRARLHADPSLIPLATTAVVLAFLVSSKVLSPQFLIWLLPSVALLLPDRRTAWVGTLLLVATALTQLEFPANYSAFLQHAPAAVWCVVARNLVLVAAFGASLRALWWEAPRG